MEQSSDDSFPSGFSNTPSVNIAMKGGNSAWRTSSGFNAYHASLFSSSLPVLPHEKLNLIDSEHGVRSIDDSSSILSNGKHVDGKDSIENPDLLEIRSLLPDDDELLAAIMDDLDLSCLASQVEESEECDLFGSGGGMELDFDPTESLTVGMAKTNISDDYIVNGTVQYGISNGVGTVAGEHPYGEHPSRTLFVRNINSNVEDKELRDLFEQYGDIRTLYTACKHRGFVMISYYDIRAARTAMRALQNKPLRRRKLDIHFSIPKNNPSDKDINQGTLVVFNLDSSVSNDDLRQIFGAYGEVKEIRETPHKRHHKFIEYYDVRAAEAALRALNRSDIAGKRIKLEPSRPGGARRNLMQQMTQEPEHDEIRCYRHQVGSPLINSPPGTWAHVSSLSDNSSLQAFSRSPTFQAGSPITNNHMPELSSILPPSISNSMRIAPIGKGNHVDQTFSNSNSTNGAQCQHCLNFPEHGSGMISNSMRIAPIGKSNHADQAFANSNSTNGVQFQHCPNFPEHGSGMVPPTISSSPVTSFGPPTSNGSGIGTLTGTQFLWGSPPPYSEHTQSSVWPTSSMGHSYQSIGLGQGFPYSRRHGSIVPSSHYHVGSAPSGVPFDRHLGFFSESPDTSFASPVAFGGMGPIIRRNEASSMMNMSARSPMNPGVPLLGNVSENGSPGFRMMSSQRLGQIFLGSPPYPGPGLVGFEGFERSRSRRGDNGVQLDSKKLFQLDLEKIVSGEDTRTTLMIKNIPNKYTSKMLLATIDEKHSGTYDFLYLPIDFKNKCNVGYAFINMVSPSHITPFYEAFNGKKWEKFNSEKVASLAYARIQGLEALTAHFQNSSLMNEDKRCRPILFHSDGPEASDQEPSPPNPLIGRACWQDGTALGASLEWPNKNTPDEKPEQSSIPGSGSGEG